MKRLLVLAVVAGVPSLVHGAELTVASAQRVPLTTEVTIERETFSLRGLPVRRAWQTVKIDAAGARRIVAGSMPSAGPQVDPHEAAIEADALPSLVRAALRLSATPSFERPAELVYLHVLGTPVLAWEVQLPLTLQPEPSRKTVWISAMTGRLLDDVEQVRSARARVFAENPSKTPEPIEVELTTLPDAEPGQPLESDVLISWNCVDEEPAEVPDWNIDEDECFPEHRVLADANGDFFVPLPDVIDEAQGITPTDRYAELSMYYHGERFLDAMRARGLERFVCEPATLQANKRKTTPEDELPFSPLNNAYFTGQCDPNIGPTMLFGQGSEVDFAYDGDVIYHELGHGVVALLVPEGLYGVRERPDAAVMDAGSINEGIADYIAFMLTEGSAAGRVRGALLVGQRRRRDPRRRERAALPRRFHRRGAQRRRARAGGALGHAQPPRRRHGTFAADRSRQDRARCAHPAAAERDLRGGLGGAARRGAAVRGAGRARLRGARAIAAHARARRLPARDRGSRERGVGTLDVPAQARQHRASVLPGADAARLRGARGRRRGRHRVHAAQPR